MALVLHRAALLLALAAPLCSLLAVSGCTIGLEDALDDISDDVSSSLACGWDDASIAFAPTAGEGTLHSAPFSAASPEIVARGAHVTVTVVLDGPRPTLAAEGDGGVDVLGAVPTYCDPPVGEEEVGTTTHWQVELAVADRGDVILQEGDGEVVTRWAPDVRQATSLSLTLDDPEACAVDSTCLIRAEIVDLDGVVLYAEEDFGWSSDGPADASPFGSYLQIAPTAAGTVQVEAEALGLVATLDVTVE